MNAAMNGTVHSYLHQAIVDNDLAEVERLLSTEGVDVNAVGENEKSPLHVAAESGNLDIVRALLQHNPTDGNRSGVHVNAPDTMGSTPLHYAVDKGHEIVVRELLDRDDINPNAFAEHNDSKTPLHIAAERGNLGIVQALLTSRHQIDVNIGDRVGSTALHHAAVGDNVKVVEELLSYCKLYNVDNAPKNHRRATPLHLAALFGKYKIVSKLIAAGLPVNKTALSRHTPLHFAVQSGSWETVRALLKDSEDLKVSEADWRGLTPVEYARQVCKTNKNGFRPESLPKQKSPQADAQEMVRMLEGFDVEGLRNDRRSYIDSANAILVGAALIASIAFTSWLQPPLGFQVLSTDSANVYLYGVAMKSFWIFNSLSFFFAISSFVTGADAALPQRFGGQVEAVSKVRIDVIRASIFLFVAVVCIILAFICAGFADLPSFPKSLTWYMTAPGVVGGLVCVYVLYLYFLKIRDAQDSNSSGGQPLRLINH